MTGLTHAIVDFRLHMMCAAAALADWREIQKSPEADVRLSHVRRDVRRELGRAACATCRPRLPAKFNARGPAGRIRLLLQGYSSSRVDRSKSLLLAYILRSCLAPLYPAHRPICTFTQLSHPCGRETTTSPHPFYSTVLPK